MLRREPNVDAGGGLEVDAWRGAKWVFRYKWASLENLDRRANLPSRFACAIIRIPLLRMKALAKWPRSGQVT